MEVWIKENAFKIQIRNGSQGCSLKSAQPPSLMVWPSLCTLLVVVVVEDEPPFTVHLVVVSLQLEVDDL